MSKPEETQVSEFSLPKGWIMAADGRPMALNSVEPYKKATHKLVGDLVGKAQDLREHMVTFRKVCDLDIDIHLEAMFEEHGKKLGGKKGSLTLQTLDGLMRIQRSVGGTLKFDEKILVAKELVMEFIQRQKGSKALKTLAYSAFEVNKEGDYSPAKLSALTRNKFDDEDWIKACDLINQSRYYEGKKPYVRFAVRETVDDAWSWIPLDFAKT